MTLRCIIEAIRENVSDFPKAREIPIVLYDRKDRMISEEVICFAEDLFVENPRSKEKFLVFLKDLEENPVMSMNVRIDENRVVVFYKSPDLMSFSRKPPLDPEEFMGYLN